MTVNIRWRGIGTVALALVLLVAAGVVLGQGPEGDKPPVDPDPTPEVVDQGTEGQEGEENAVDADAIIFAQAPQTINYQGYLTDSSGNPLDGTYDLVFHLYDEELAGVAEWGPETHNDVEVRAGLFQVALGATVILYPNDFDEALYLAVQVDGVDVTPRQPLRAVPYAFGLVPGAEVEGDPGSGNYALRVENTGLGSTDRGLYAKGEQYGIYAEEVGDGSDVGIYSPDFVHAQGFRSDGDSYLWVPATAGMLYPKAGCALYPSWHGNVRLQCTLPGASTVEIDIPITVPAVLYAQEVRVREVRVYYKLDHAGSYITRSSVRRLANAVDSVALIDDYQNRTSTTATSYALEPTANYTLTASSGALNMHLGIVHDGDAAHDVYIGGVRVRLRHYDEP